MRDGAAGVGGWLRERGVVALDEVDTRALVRRIRGERRRCAARSATAPVDELHARALAEPPIDGRPLRRHMGTREPYTVGGGPRVVAPRPRLQALDPGAGSPRPASRCSSSRRTGTPTRSSTSGRRPCWSATAPAIPRCSTGPIETMRDLLGEVPLFGICLGHQLLGLALGLETYKLPFGHRGANHPVRELAHRPRARHRPEPRLRGARRRRGASATSRSTTAACEGLEGDGFASVQFHPEAAPGPARRPALLRPDRRRMPKRTDLRSILIVGSGPIRIGQACEFDYAGAQACRVLRREGYRVVLVNSNPATIMTDPEWADATYLEPLDVETVARDHRARAARRAAADARRPDGAEPRAGAAEAGVLDRLGVELIGADLDAIRRAEDRELFRETVAAAGLHGSRERDRRRRVAEAESFPVPAIVRPAFTLGGTGGGIAHTREELRAQVAPASPRARSARCWSSAFSRAGRSTSSR